MKTEKLAILAILLLLFSCKKETKVISTPVDMNPILLKDIAVERLPSPYYHFEYDASGKPTFVSFASEFFRYNVFYSGGRISEMRNDILVNKDRIQYTYDTEGRVSEVEYADSTGVIKTLVGFTYQANQLIRLERKRKMGGGFTADKEVTLSYLPDGNLQELVFHYLPVNGAPETSEVDRYEQFDNGTNVDAFGLIKNEFFDHLVLLPAVRLMKNNPGKTTITVNGRPFLVTNDSYQYNNANLPTVKTSELNILNGADSGKVFIGHTNYTYY